MLFCIMSDHCEVLRVIRHNRCLDLGNGSNKFGNHCFNSFLILLNLGKYLSPEQLVTTKLRNKASRGCINQKPLI